MLRLPYKTRFYFIKIKSNRAVEMWCTHWSRYHIHADIFFSLIKRTNWLDDGAPPIYLYITINHQPIEYHIQLAIEIICKKFSLLTSSIRFVRSVAIFITECVWEQNLMKMKMKFNAISVQSNRLKWNYTRNECTKWEEKKKRERDATDDEKVKKRIFRYDSHERRMKNGCLVYCG